MGLRAGFFQQMRRSCFQASIIAGLAGIKGAHYLGGIDQSGKKAFQSFTWLLTRLLTDKAVASMG